MRIKGWNAVCRLRGKGALGPRRSERYSLAYTVRVFRWVFGILRRGQGVPRLRARPKGAALWNPAAFEKAGETFFLRSARFCSSLGSRC